MASGTVALAAWSYGLVGLSYSVFTLKLLQFGYLRLTQEISKTTLLAAVTLSAVWGWASLAQLLTDTTLFLVLGTSSDLLRYGSWYAFLLILLRSNSAEKALLHTDWMVLTAVALQLFGVCGARGPRYSPRGHWQRGIAHRSRGLPPSTTARCPRVC